VLEIRAPTRRPNIRYLIRRLGRGTSDILTATATLIRSRWASLYGMECGLNRAILFVRSKGEAEKLVGSLECEYYHSQIASIEEKAAIVSRGTCGQSSPFLVGTSSLGTGLDYRHIRVAIHVEEPYGLANFVQESGRAGRDGQAADSLVILNYGWKPPSHFPPSNRSMYE